MYHHLCQLRKPDSHRTIGSMWNGFICSWWHYRRGIMNLGKLSPWQWAHLPFALERDLTPVSQACKITCPSVWWKTLFCFLRIYLPYKHIWKESGTKMCRTVRVQGRSVCQRKLGMMAMSDLNPFCLLSKPELATTLALHQNNFIIYQKNFIMRGNGAVYMNQPKDIYSSFYKCKTPFIKKTEDS